MSATLHCDVTAENAEGRRGFVIAAIEGSAAELNGDVWSARPDVKWAMARPRLLQRPLHINEISGETIDSAMQVHSTLGPGLLESAYQECLKHEVQLRSLIVQSQVPVPIMYRGTKIRTGYRIDLLVENAVIVELKAVKQIHPIHEAQVLSQLRLGDHRVALLINFHVRQLRNGITRIVNRL